MIRILKTSLLIDAGVQYVCTYVDISDINSVHLSNEDVTRYTPQYNNTTNY